MYLLKACFISAESPLDCKLLHAIVHIQYLCTHSQACRDLNNTILNPKCLSFLDTVDSIFLLFSFIAELLIEKKLSNFTKFLSEKLWISVYVFSFYGPSNKHAPYAKED